MRLGLATPFLLAAVALMAIHAAGISGPALRQAVSQTPASSEASDSVHPTQPSGSVEPPVAVQGLGRVAFVREGDIWTKDLPDGEEMRLTDCGGRTSPKWSPSGEWLTFLKDEEAWIIRRSGGEARPGAARAVWSPVEDRLALVDRASIMAIRLDGTDRVKLADLSGDARDPRTVTLAWSPDGQWLAYTRFEWPPPGPTGVVPRSALWRVSAAGTEKARLFEASGQIVVAGWSGNAAHILYWHGMYSASIRADGFPLFSVATTGGEPIKFPKGRPAAPHQLGDVPRALLLEHRASSERRGHRAERAERACRAGLRHPEVLLRQYTGLPISNALPRPLAHRPPGCRNTAENQK